MSGDSALCLSPLVKIAGTADVLVQQGRALRGLRARRSVQPVPQDRGDAVVGQHPDLDRAQAHCLGAVGGQAAEQAQNADAGPKSLLGMRPARQNRQDQRLRMRSEIARLSGKSIGAPFGVAPVCARHMRGVGALARGRHSDAHAPHTRWPR